METEHRGRITQTNTIVTLINRKQSEAALEEMKLSYRYFVLKGKARVAENTSKFLLDQKRKEFTEGI